MIEVRADVGRMLGGGDREAGGPGGPGGGGGGADVALIPTPVDALLSTLQVGMRQTGKGLRSSQSLV